MRSAYINIVSIAMLVGLGASPAQAQQGNDGATAEQLFMQGRELMKQDNLDEACARFEASPKFDPALDTLLNLGLCRKEQGKVASAWALYREAEVQARREGVALTVTGVVLYMAAPERVEKAGFAVVPVAGPSELGMAVQGGV